MKGAFKFSLASVVLVGLIASPSWATVILGPSLATTNMGESFPLVHSIDQSGLSAGYVSGVTDFDTYVASATHVSNPGTDWVSNATTGSATFDLGGIFSIDRAAVWNFGSGSGTPTFAIKDISLFASLDGITFSPLGGFTLTNPNGAPNTLAQVLTFGPVSAEFIRMDVISTYGSPAALGEIAFAEAVPEPGTLFLIGGGLIGIVARRRRMS